MLQLENSEVEVVQGSQSIFQVPETEWTNEELMLRPLPITNFHSSLLTCSHISTLRASLWSLSEQPTEPTDLQILCAPEYRFQGKIHFPQ